MQLDHNMEHLGWPRSPMSEHSTTEYLLEQLCAGNHHGIRQTCEVIRELGNRRCQEALHNSEPEVRATAAQALGAIGDGRAVACLCCLLREVDPSGIQLGRDNEPVWVEAAKALGEIGDPRAVETLVGALRNPFLRVICESEGALIRIGRPAVGHLMAALRSPVQCIRLGAVRALSGIGAPEAVEPLMGIAGNPTESIGVRIEAVRALGVIGDPRSMAVLELLIHQQTPDLRAESAKARQRMLSLTGKSMGRSPAEMERPVHP
jgi:HEAT repeat protein